MADIRKLEKLAKLARYWSLVSTTEAGSGHPSSSLSAADLMTGLLFGGAFRFDADRPKHPNNDRLIFSKGHASPLLYSLWLAAGRVTAREIMTLRKFGSVLEGHPTTAFPYAEAATGSLGQGLSIGAGMALNAKYIDKLPYRTYVLLGDSEMAEGSQWEAMELAAHYKLDNLVGVLDMNGLGQRGETMYGRDPEIYSRKAAAFGWEPIVIDGHDLPQILAAYEQAGRAGRPVLIIAKTSKGKGVSFIEDRNGWHGRVLKKDELARALEELGPTDLEARGETARPAGLRPPDRKAAPAAAPAYGAGEPVSTRRAYGAALARLVPQYPEIVVLDAEVSNSTFAETFAKACPERFFEMFIAEQNMVAMAIGLSLRGRVPFVSTFAAFLTRAFDQIRMCRYSDCNIKFCGSHAGVSIGADGSSQMGLEDIAMFRTLLDGVVLYPSDAVSAERLTEEAAKHRGIVYLRTTREDTPVLYRADEEFPIGGSKVLKKSGDDVAVVVAAGITLHEALAAHEELKKEGIAVGVIDLYSVKPVDARTLAEAALATGRLITVEDHFAEGGLGEAVRSALAGSPAEIHSLAVRKMPKSGRPGELLDYEEISRRAIVKKVKEILAQRLKNAKETVCDRTN
jgi:transketolase